MIGSVLAVVGSSPASERVLETAVDLARAERARLTLMLPVAPPAWCVCFSPVPPAQVLTDVQGACDVVLRRLADACARDVPITTVMHVGRLEQAVLRELERRPHDVVVLEAGGRGRWRRRDPVARLARRCPVPLITVPPLPDGAPRTVELGAHSACHLGVRLPANPS
jgi:nucleotide-binding universal stress UspA family protein